MRYIQRSIRKPNNFKLNTMTREEQLQFCRVCRNRQMDYQKGLSCSLTNDIADFDGICPNYDEEAKEVEKEKQVQVERERSTKEDLTVSGWLALFLWLVIGGGAIASLILSILDVYRDFNFIILLYYLILLPCIILTAYLTIKGFYKRDSKAVSLAKTYIAIKAIDTISSIIMSVILDDYTGIQQIVRSMIWCGIWYSYIVNSKKVKVLIPEEIRTWGKTEKLILAIVLMLNIFLLTLVSIADYSM